MEADDVYKCLFEKDVELKRHDVDLKFSHMMFVAAFPICRTFHEKTFGSKHFFNYDKK